MLQIPEEFILKTLENAYIQYDKYSTVGDREKALKIYGFCDGLEKIIYRFAPDYSKQVKSMKAQSKISDEMIENDLVNLDEPTIFRKNN